MEQTTGQGSRSTARFQPGGLLAESTIGHNNDLSTRLPHETVSTLTPGTPVFFFLSPEPNASHKVASQYRLVE